MAKKTYKIAARIPNELADELEEIRQKEGLKNKSEALRVCIEQYIETRNKNYHTDALVLNIPMGMRGMIDTCLESGIATDANELIKMALVDWMARHMSLLSTEPEVMKMRLAKWADKARENKIAEKEGKRIVC